METFLWIFTVCNLLLVIFTIVQISRAVKLRDRLQTMTADAVRLTKEADELNLKLQDWIVKFKDQEVPLDFSEAAKTYFNSRN